MRAGLITPLPARAGFKGTFAFVPTGANGASTID